MIKLESEAIATRARTGAAGSGMLPRGNKPAGDGPALDEPETLFREAVRLINKRYQAGTLARIQAERPDMAADMGQAFDQLETAFREAGPVAGEPFRRALRTWYNSTMKAIDSIQRR